MEIIRFLHLRSNGEACWDQDVSMFVRQTLEVNTSLCSGSRHRAAQAHRLGSGVSGDGPKPSECGATTALPAFAHAVLLDVGAFTLPRARHQVRRPPWVTPG